MPPEVVRAGGQHPERSGQGRGRSGRRRPSSWSSSGCSSSRRRTSARCSPASSRTSAVERALVFTRTKHGAEPGRPAARPATGCRPTRSTATSRRARASARSKASRRRRPRARRDRHRRARHRRRRHHARRSTTTCPNVPESYVHRIGRTARAGQERRRDLVLRCRGARIPARHRGADQDAHPGGGGASVDPGASARPRPAQRAPCRT